MRFKSLALIAAIGCFSASAYALPTEGSAVTVGGRAHIEQEGSQTYVYLNGFSSAAGVIPFEDRSSFPNLDRLDGRDLQITGIVNGEGEIQLTNSNQIRVTD